MDFTNTSQAPSGDLVAVTPHDTDPIIATAEGQPVQATRGIYVGVAGDVVVITRKGQTVTLVELAAGIIHPIQVTHVKSTGTAATDIVAVY